MKKVIFMVLFSVMMLTGCSNASSSSDVLQNNTSNNLISSENNKVIRLSRLKNNTVTLGNINMFTSVDEQLYNNFQIINTYDEFVFLKNEFNSDKYVFQKLIDLLKNENYEKEYFENNSLIISPFLHSSDEKNISFLDIQIDDLAKTIDITFQFESPECVDFDVIVDFFIIEVEKQGFIGKSDYVKSIHGFNLLTNSKGSSCYGSEEK